jgi:hypothetical protein
MGRFTAQLFQESQVPGVRRFNVDNAGVGQPVLKQRRGLLNSRALNDSASTGIQSRADGFNEIPVSSQHQYRLHELTAQAASQDS